ncbi:MAG: tetraacyldisaccharide 4'-kinase [Bacteroidales bacterium]|nr:tetraacyldisaccharide 4'-kinase [Bacteroidales bacterium]
MFRFLLYPFSLIYGSIVLIRNILFDFHILKSREFNFPVIAIGNITVGGTGKTPHAEYLVKLLKDKYRVAVLSRGYKRKTKGFVVAEKNPKSEDIGDEPAQIKMKFPEIEVAVNANRVKGIEILEERKNDLVILDDAFQHRYVKPGLSILLIDYNRRIDEDFLLPFGNLRENAREIRRADIILITKTPESLKPINRRLVLDRVKPYPYQEVYFTTFTYGNLSSVFTNKSVVPENFKTRHELYTILLVTGIASSKPIIEYLKTLSLDIKHLKFVDHSEYDKTKINKILSTFKLIKNDNKIIITTEKDAIKFREAKNLDELLLKNMFYIPIEVSFIEREEEFNEQITKYVSKNKRNN